jgi:hypothetical protein
MVISAPAQIVNGDASMGQELAQKWCNDCRAVGAEDGSVHSFVLIAEMCFSIGGLNWRRLASPQISGWNDSDGEPLALVFAQEHGAGLEAWQTRTRRGTLLYSGGGGQALSG